MGEWGVFWWRDSSASLRFARNDWWVWWGEFWCAICFVLNEWWVTRVGEVSGLRGGCLVRVECWLLPTQEQEGGWEGSLGEGLGGFVVGIFGQFRDVPAGLDAASDVCQGLEEFVGPGCIDFPDSQKDEACLGCFAGCPLQSFPV